MVRMRDRRSIPVAVSDMGEEVDCKSAMRKNIEISIDIFVILVVISAGISAALGSRDAPTPSSSSNNNNSSSRGNFTLAPTPLPVEGNQTTELPDPTESPSMSPSLTPTNFFLYDAPLDDYCQELMEYAAAEEEQQQQPSSWWQQSPYRNDALQRSIELVLDVKLAEAAAFDDIVWIQDITTAMNQYMIPLLVGCNTTTTTATTTTKTANNMNTINTGDPSAYAISNATIVHEDTNVVGEEEVRIRRVILTIHCLLKGYEDNDWIMTRISNILNLAEEQSDSDSDSDSDSGGGPEDLTATTTTALVKRLNLTDLLETLSVVQIVPTRSASLKSILGSDLQSLTSDRKFILHPQAFYWLAELDTWKNTAIAQETSYTWMSRYVLAIVFYENVFVGDVVNQTDNGTSRFQTWLTSSENVCEWSGLDCDGDGVLTRVYLDYDELSGHMPSQIGLLTHLTYLNLFQNALTGPVTTEIGKLTALKAVFLAGNMLTGPIPSEIGQLSSLTRLSIPNNNFSGPLPSEIGQLTGLVAVLLGDNKLAGMIPSQIGMLTSATRLRMNGNALTGSIPAEIRQLTSLTGLFFNKNNLTGPIPSEIGMLTSLTELSFDQNSLTGTIPPSIGDLTGLMGLHLYDNELSGEIPSEMSQLSTLGADQCQILEGNFFNDTSSMPGVCT